MEFDVRKISDPVFFEENRMAAHSDHICYQTKEEAQLESSGLRYSLDGVWKSYNDDSWI